MDLFKSVFGKKAAKMDLVFGNLRMVLFLKVNGWMIRWKVTVSSNILLAKHTRATGLKVNRTEREATFIEMGTSIRATG